MSQFHTIGLIGRLGNDLVLQSVEILQQLLLARQLRVIVEDEIAQSIDDCQMEVANRQQIGEQCDLVIVIGGDGSLLGAARAMVRHGVPILGINRGRLGFLTDIHPDSIEEKVTEVLDGHYHAEKRFLLAVSVLRDGERIAKGNALNDVVVNSGRSARMINFDLYMDGSYVYSQDSDGLIVSTPTGSTAYSLSGGGPIMHPGLDAIAIVPMFPHTLSARPTVVSGDTEIKVIIGDCHPYVSCDGQVHLNTAPGDVVVIQKRSDQLTLLHPLDHDFYKSCRDKLGWSGRLID
ncbi:NAD+ kinase [Sinobacterium caligoides]|uniref:NAD kinase n=1 Tax=Sinobacterium caligoides TaxID=933926 RepID=A0A3N2DNP4_9GAMM|nr:NAD(+) kinase [Sinobacterium caligoides]ROS01312.1 NAD+ kinase [Sinobacterium caligoides]